MKKIILTLLVLIIIFPQSISLAEEEKVHPCRKAWNDKMKEYDDEYIAGLNNLLFQKTKTSTLIDSEAISYNLRSHNCKIYQVCDAVRLSLSSPEEDIPNLKVTGKLMRCQPRDFSEFTEIQTQCTDEQFNSQNTETQAAWKLCEEQAETIHIASIENVTETEILKSNSAKKTSNLVGYLIELNKKLDVLSMEIGDMIGVLFDVTRKMTCVQRSCQ